MKSNRFQNQITTGRFTLPVAVLLLLSSWIVSAFLLPEPNIANSHPLWNALCDFSIPVWADSILSFLLYGIIGYLLIELNNTFAIIRMRASVQTAVYFLLITVCPHIQTLYAGDVATVAFLIALFFLFQSYRYQQSNATGALFYAFIFLGISSVVFPPLTLFIPVFWIGAFNFRSLYLKSFLASLIGWSLPYWFLLGHAYMHGQMELFYQPFQELANFQPIQFNFPLWELATIGYLFILYVVSSVHCLMSGHEDKIRTRSYLHFLIFLNLCIFIYILLQPSLTIHLLSFLFIGISILAGHFFALTTSRTSNLFFIVMLIGLLSLYGLNIWTLL